MTEWALHSTPRPRGVLREQVRAVGLVLRPSLIAAAALLGVASLFAVRAILGGGPGMAFHPERWVLPGLAGLLLPMAVWHGEERFGSGFLWTLPVDRRWHALAKVGAGWVWLMAAVSAFVLWLLLLTLASGGRPLAEETLLVIPPFPLPGPRLDPSVIRTVSWTPGAVLWLVPFAAATAMYLLASALALGVRYPLRWITGVVLGFFVVSAGSDAADLGGVARLPSRLLESLLTGRYGMETLLVAGTETLKIETLLTTGRSVVVWRGVPDPGRWAAAALLWTAAGLLALWVAASRHRERRRG